MISMDKYILEFIGNNWLALMMLLMLIQGIAKITPGTWDDKVATLFQDILNFARSGGKENKK